MLRDLTSLPRAVRGVRWDGLALAVDGPDRPPLRWETAEGRRLLLRQGGRTVLLARQRVTHHGVHYARTGRYASPLPPLRAATARARRAAAGDDEDAWAARWAPALAEGGRPRILRLGRAPAGGPVPPGGPHLLRAYEERAACLERARTAGDPLAPTRIATAGRRLDAELRALSDGFGLTRGWPLPGGAPAWEASARRHAPGWHPDATR
ncbi:hypothetical protein ACFXO2_24015 [Streptomyces sp. NPDC059152]|uniref:hypothetical protein n=1 Tax=Streptomyces sp. NPDC059152 TaxID=3346742 RepID=UPI0036C3FEB3